MIHSLYRDALRRIRSAEQEISYSSRSIVDDTYRITTMLRDQLLLLKSHVLQEGFSSEIEEIEFFKTIKPQILGNLIYYNKVYRIESSCPVAGGKSYRKYFLAHMQKLREEHERHICGNEFYRYYKTGRSDWDHYFFRLGKIDLHNGLNSFEFEIDVDFSTLYDFKVAKIIASELLHEYLREKLEPNTFLLPPQQGTPKDLVWTESKNALIELIYALHLSGSISHGKLGIRKISSLFQTIFGIQLGDVHHAFHRMKDRAKNRSQFLDHLKASLEQHMDKEL